MYTCLPVHAIQPSEYEKYNQLKNYLLEWHIKIVQNCNRQNTRHCYWTARSENKFKRKNKHNVENES